MVESPTACVLLIEDDPAYARLIEMLLVEESEGRYAVERAGRLDEGLELLKDGHVDAVLLDLTLPDSKGLDTFVRANDAAPEVPIVVLTGFDDEQLALDAVKRGAQDYLVKGHAENDSLARSLRYAMERHRMQAELRQQALVDELTGLRNRRGFMTLAEPQLNLARRSGYPVTLLFIDLDGMKSINDVHGHAEGDRALKDTAMLLEQSFRISDLLARMGGDEFCALLPDCSEDDREAAVGRLREHLEAHNERRSRPYQLSLSIGGTTRRPDDERPVTQLIEAADRSMYEEKSGRTDPR
jgi:two-component system cell cycle response regulator